MSLIPHLIHFPKIGDSHLGYISIAEKSDLPFDPKRLYWTYYTPEDVTRGYHAHYELQQILIALSGNIEIEIETDTKEKFNFILNSPHVGLFIPKLCWRKMKYSHNSVQLCIASMEYDENDYIRDYNVFQSIQK